MVAGSEEELELDEEERLEELADSLLLELKEELLELEEEDDWLAEELEMLWEEDG